MYTSFSIENFRLFDRLTVEPLARVNLIAGQNNMGKTAILEAMWMLSHATAPRQALRVSQWRDTDIYGQGEFFADLFFQYNAGTVINLRAESKLGNLFRTLGITRQYRSQQPLFDWSGVSDAEMEDDTISNFDFDNELVFEHTDETGGMFLNRAWLDADAASGRLRPILRDYRESVSTSGYRCVFERSKSRYNARSLSTLFGRAQFTGHVSAIEKILRLLEPRLQRMETITDNRGIPSIYMDIGAERPFPVSVMGEGTKRLLALSLAFLRARNGVMLIDEIENGLHHNALVDVWKNLDWLSREFNVQVFATTHSYECIVAAHAAFKQAELDDDFSLLRLQRSFKTGRIECVAYDDKEALDYAMEYEREVR